VTHDPKAAEVGDRLVRLADGVVVGDELLRAAA
jgi:ABC-type lipoprotein export system ATPase subunit